MNPYRELPDSGKVELLDGNTPTGSGNEISEMPQSPSPAPLFELGTRHTSIATSSLRRQSDRNRNAIYVKTGILHESSDSSAVLKESPCVETVISSSPGHKSVEPLASPPQWTPEYLNRALPSIPSSESTRGSPTKTHSSSRSSVTNHMHSLSSRTSTIFTDSGSIRSDGSLEKSYKDYDMSWESNRRPEPSLLSPSSTDIEIMILPEVTEKQLREHPSISPLSPPDVVEIVIPPKSKAPSSASGGQSERRYFF